jgi:arachidonate 15-lipoxygenase
LSELLALGQSSVGKIKDSILAALKFDGRFGAPDRMAKSLNEYADLFRAVGLPPIARDYAEDRSFAAMRTAGPNPVTLQRVKTLDSRFPVTNDMLRITAPGDSLEAALEEGRLYLADYALLDGAELGNFPNGQKYLYAPLALFVVTKPGKELLPVAIQCKQTPAPNNPILTPDDGYNWLIAKTIVEIADANMHEASTHLGRTHLAMEPFVIAMYRRLATNHPLYLLLAPHFEGTLAINKAAWQHLIAEKGAVDKLMGGSIATSRGVAAKGVQSLHIMDDLLPKAFARKGVDNRELFPVYPYRDDSLLYWEAIHEWVDAYLRIYYKSDSDLHNDYEAQAWAYEVGASDGGRMRGMPNNGQLRQVSELVDVVTFVIYTCSVQHAAVNFPQYDLMSYVPNMPCAGYRPAPTSKKGATEADYLAMLPPMNMAELQMELGYLLGSVHYTQLGQYQSHQFADPQVKGPLQRFQKRIAEIGKTIESRNQTRRPYETLAPTGVPQSINI